MVVRKQIYFLNCLVLCGPDMEIKGIEKENTTQNLCSKDIYNLEKWSKSKNLGPQAEFQFPVPLVRSLQVTTLS